MWSTNWSIHCIFRAALSTLPLKHSWREMWMCFRLKLHCWHAFHFSLPWKFIIFRAFWRYPSRTTARNVCPRFQFSLFVSTSNFLELYNIPITFSLLAPCYLQIFSTVGRPHLHLLSFLSTANRSSFHF